MNAKLAIYEEVAEFEPIELCRIRSCIKIDLRRLKNIDEGPYRTDYGPHVPTGGIDREIEIREACLERINKVLDRMEEEYDPYEWSQVTA